MDRRKANIGLAIILLAELYLFTGSFDKFFNHDSLFYLIHSPKNWQEFQRYLFAPDPTQQYRPLTLGTTALMVPHFGLNPRPYHWIPVIFHLLNTLLFYRLVRRILPGRMGALSATAFWALHSVAGGVTYDIAYISSFLGAFFVLSALGAAIDAHAKRSHWRLALSLVLYCAALLTRESALMMPAALFIALVIRASARAPEGSQWAETALSLRRSFIFVLPFAALSLAHAGLMVYWVQAGVLYPQAASNPYSIGLWHNLAAKATYLYWALNLPDTLVIEHANRTRILASLLMTGFFAIWAFDLFRRRLKFRPAELGGLVWLLAMNLPAFMLSGRTAKWYLYVPVMGLAITVGCVMERLPALIPRLRLSGASLLALVILFIPNAYSSAVQTKSLLLSSDSSYASTVVESCLRDLQGAYPRLPREVTLFLLPTFQERVWEFFGGGILYQLYYPESRIRMLFADRGDPLPAGFPGRDDVLILQYMYGHVYDVTHSHGRRLAENLVLRPVSKPEGIRVSVDRSEYYQDYERFETPGGTAAFFPTPGREILTQIGGSTVESGPVRIPAGARLRFETSWMHSDGDGGWAELRIRAAGREDTLHRERLGPKPRGRPVEWNEHEANLGTYAGKDAELILRCYNDPGHTTVADWLNWRDLRIQSPR